MAELNLEEQLNTRFLNDCNEVQRKGYTPRLFRQMLAKRGAVETVNRLLSTKEYSEGFTRLWELKALHLSMEAIILQEPYSQLFTPEQLQIARTRLTQLNYKFD
jgi:hypothetical protein